MSKKGSEARRMTREEIVRDRFVDQPGDTIISQCVACVHVHMGRCDAFPDGIPQEILENWHDHRLAYPGDNGIRFEQDPDMLPACFEPMDDRRAST